MLHHTIPIAVGLLCLVAYACASIDRTGCRRPAPAPAPDALRLGAHIQRTMTLLATSTPERRNRVRVLFYGQSITEQSWSVEVADFLRSHFPYADLEIENRAIGGFSSDLLVKTAETDLYPFYPDLTVLHAYGDAASYEEIIVNLRRRTTSEVLIQNDHVAADDGEADQKDHSRLTPDDAAQWRSYVFLPRLARAYGCELVDQRTPWLQYLKENDLAPQALLEDRVHLNAHGNRVMAELVKEHLRYRPDLPDGVGPDLTRTCVVGAELDWRDGRMVFDFDGNRVDLISGPGAGDGQRLRVLVDGAPPSTRPELYAFTRASLAPDLWWPAVIGLGRAAPPVVEDWTAHLFDASDDMKRFRFSLVGSETGPDGEGSSDERFVSHSRRIVIQPSAWERLVFARQYLGRPLPSQFDVTWSVVPLFTDEYAAPEFAYNTSETATTLVQGLANGCHRLELVTLGKRVPRVKALRVYRPPLRETADASRLR